MSWTSGATYQFGAFTRPVGSTELFVATAGNTADVLPQGAWTALWSTGDGP